MRSRRHWKRYMLCIHMCRFEPQTPREAGLLRRSVLALRSRSCERAYRWGLAAHPSECNTPTDTTAGCRSCSITRKKKQRSIRGPIPCLARTIIMAQYCGPVRGLNIGPFGTISRLSVRWLCHGGEWLGTDWDYVKPGGSGM